MSVFSLEIYTILQLDLWNFQFCRPSHQFSKTVTCRFSFLNLHQNFVNFGYFKLQFSRIFTGISPVCMAIALNCGNVQIFRSYAEFWMKNLQDSRNCQPSERASSSRSPRRRRASGGPAPWPHPRSSRCRRSRTPRCRRGRRTRGRPVSRLGRRLNKLNNFLKNLNTSGIFTDFSQNSFFQELENS